MYSYRAEDVEYGCLKFVGGEPFINKAKIASIKELTHLEDSGSEKIEYYWVTFRSCPEWYKNKKIDRDMGLIEYLKRINWEGTNTEDQFILPPAKEETK